MCDTRWLTLYPLVRECGEQSYHLLRSLYEMPADQREALRRQVAERQDAYALAYLDWMLDNLREYQRQRIHERQLEVREATGKWPEAYADWCAGTREVSDAG